MYITQIKNGLQLEPGDILYQDKKYSTTVLHVDSTSPTRTTITLSITEVIETEVEKAKAYNPRALKNPDIGNKIQYEVEHYVSIHDTFLTLVNIIL